MNTATQTTNVLIIGAGPFGLSVAAYVQHLGLDYVVVGKIMEFWEKNMPEGMLLRSPCSWHLDVTGDATIEKYLALANHTPQQAEPISLDLYIRYVKWFEAQKQLNIISTYIEQLDRTEDGHFLALTNSGESIKAKKVVIAIGFKYFTNLPADIIDVLSEGSYAHTCDFVQLHKMAGKRCLILGGRQSAFEWAALLHEAGAAQVHVAYRHATPTFTEADWSWVEQIVDNMPAHPDWYRELTTEQQDQVFYNLWAEGRLKLEPWLESRISVETVHLLPHSKVTSCEQQPDGTYQVQFDIGNTVEVDHIALATGYKPDLERVPFLKHGNLLPQLSARSGFPYLDSSFQTNVPGLFITSLPAGKDFGPFFGFTVAARTSAKIIGDKLISM
ncbi:MAG: NAD(P)-binding domain-containing protein [Spirosomataceae bacterium]